MVNFSTQIPDCDSHSPALLDLFISSDATGLQIIFQNRSEKVSPPIYKGRIYVIYNVVCY